ncbi:MAG: LptF/LptG family permease [Thermoanaerobaculia bacterium]
MKRIDSYILREILGPFGLGFLVYTLILLLQFLFASAEMIIRRGLPVSIVGKLLATSLPNIVVLTIPMGLLFGVLIAVGRLASDSELIALRACGVSLYRLARPIVLFSFALGLINLYFTLQLLPVGNQALQDLRLRILTQTIGQQVEPRVFYNDFPGKVLYVFEAAAGNPIWRGVFLADSVPMPGQRNEVTVAQHGTIEIDETGERVILRLDAAIKHSIDFEHPQRYDVTRNQSLRTTLKDQFLSGERERMLRRKGVRQMSLDELARVARDPNEIVQQRRLARVEIHKKFAIPAACFVFGLVALPLGFTNRRGGKTSGFAISIGVLVAFWMLLSQGEKSAAAGRLSPALAMWLPNLLLAGFGLLLLALRDRDRGLLRPLLRRLPALRPRIAALRERRRAAGRARSRAAEGGAAASIVLRLPRLRLAFPNLLDRYILRRFGFVLALVAASAISLALIADFTANLDEILKNHVSTSLVLRYYEYLSLQTFFDVAPVTVLVATLMTFSLLARSNEVTACRALGISLYRLGVPALAGAAMVAVFCWFLQSSVLPASNQKVDDARARIRGEEAPLAVRSADRQWLIGQGRYVYNYLNFDSRSRSLQRLQVFEFDDRHQIVGRLYARTAQYTPKGWVFADGWARRFEGLREVSYKSFTTPVLVDLPETPEYFASDRRRPDEMSFTELAAYIRDLEASGQTATEESVDLHRKIAFPVTSVVMALVALPFAFRLGKRGTLYGIGFAIALGIVFLAVYAFFATLGEVGALPAAIAVWSPAVLFTLLASYLFLGVRS